MALKPDITAALETGVKRRTFYEEHREALGTSYVQFTRYVARHITGKASQKPRGSPRAAIDHRDAGAADERQAPAPKRDGPISTPAKTTPKFEFDPTKANRPGRDKELF